MPTFYAEKTTVQLSVADLGRATTLTPHTQQSLAASRAIRNAAQEFARGSKDGTLTETPLYAEDGSHVRFLGKHGIMPFFMVHAGKNFFDSNTKEKRNRRPARIPLAGASGGESTSTAADMNGEAIGVGTDKDGKTPRYRLLSLPDALPASIEPNREYKPPFKPHALCLTVFLSPSSFIRTRNTVAGRVEITDVKIDVYFNGALCDSRYVPRRYSSDAFTMTEHIVRFSGRRIGRLIEKPWIFVPSGQNPDGSLRDYRRGKVAYAGTQQRWNDISDALLAEADKFGRDERGERPVIGEYLESLAELSMPKEVEDMQKAGGPKFGVLDVVVMWGKGSKDGPDAPYIVEPTPMRIEGSTTSVNMVQSMNPSSAQDVVTTSPRNAYTVPQSGSEALATAKAIDDDYSNTSPLAIPPSPAPTATNSKTTPAALFPSPPDKPSIPAALPFETPIRRPRGHYYDVITSKQTLSEEINSIATTAATILDPKAAGYYNPATTTLTTKARTTRASYASTAHHGSPLNNSSASTMTPARTKVVTLKLSSSSSPNNGSSSSATATTTTRPTLGNTMMMSNVRVRGAVHGDGKAMDPRAELPTPSLFEEEERKNPAAPPSNLKPGTRRTRERAQQQQSAAANAAAADGGGSRLVGFVVPGLSVDCGATYAAGGTVRNVGAARGGVFCEGGVLMGARFVVG